MLPLDEATQRQLIRGAQLRELLQQAPAQPLSVVQQVAIIYTGTRTSILVVGQCHHFGGKGHRQRSGQIGTAIHGLAIRHAEDGCIHGYQPSSKAGTGELKLVEAIEPCIWVPRELAQNVTRPAVSTGQVTNSDVNHVVTQQ